MFVLQEMQFRCTSRLMSGVFTCMRIKDGTLWQDTQTSRNISSFTLFKSLQSILIIVVVSGNINVFCGGDFFFLWGAPEDFLQTALCGVMRAAWRSAPKATHTRPPLSGPGSVESMQNPSCTHISFVVSSPSNSPTQNCFRCQSGLWTTTSPEGQTKKAGSTPQTSPRTLLLFLRMLSQHCKKEKHAIWLWLISLLQDISWPQNHERLCQAQKMGEVKLTHTLTHFCGV